MDADVRLRAKQILAPNLPIDDLDATLNLNDGVLSFAPAAFGVANGRMEIYSRFDGSKRPSKVKIDARFRQLDLKRFLGESSFAQKSLAPISGRIVLIWNRRVLSRAHGNCRRQRLPGDVGRADQRDARRVGRARRRRIPRLSRARRPVYPGPLCGWWISMDRMDKWPFKLSSSIPPTRSSKAKVRSTSAMKRVDIVVLPVPKDFSPLSLRSYIRAHGPFNDLSVFPDPIKTGTDSLLKKIFNVLTMLVLSPLQPRDIGQGTDVDCDAADGQSPETGPKGNRRQRHLQIKRT